MDFLRFGTDMLFGELKANLEFGKEFIVRSANELGQIVRESKIEWNELWSEGFRQIMIEGNPAWDGSYKQFIANQTRRRELGEPLVGDVLVIERMGGVYDHYAIYLGNQRVIHYTSDTGDFGDNEIQITGMERFLDGRRHYRTIDFSEYGTRVEISFPDQDAVNFFHPPADFDRLKANGEFRLFSPEKTVIRARECLGEKRYDLFENNCEHFAIWCRTGMAKSSQVEKFFGPQSVKRFALQA